MQETILQETGGIAKCQTCEYCGGGMNIKRQDRYLIYSTGFVNEGCQS